MSRAEQNSTVLPEHATTMILNMAMPDSLGGYLSFPILAATCRRLRTHQNWDPVDVDACPGQRGEHSIAICTESRAIVSTWWQAMYSPLCTVHKENNCDHMQKEPCYAYSGVHEVLMEERGRSRGSSALACVWPRGAKNSSNSSSSSHVPNFERWKMR